MILHRDEARPTVLLGDVQCLLKLPRPLGGGADVARGQSAHHIVQGFHRLFNGRLVVLAMDPVEVVPSRTYSMVFSFGPLSNRSLN